MFSHVNLGSNDLARSRKFYDAVLAVVGAAPGADIDFNSPRIVYQHDDCLLVITSPLDGKPASIANGGTIGFAIGSIEQVEAFHAAALAHGGSTCEDPPGERSTPFGAFYLAYVRDPDGNKLCAFHKPA
ncbi:glyoxalase [Burkholderia lata]|uniref:VOC family protein n=1 Tax=Burkholderia lata (strain ATCC 17760 / DSM 23089 / LMG 22485 / NCIMB 9086 / R18194 / 383) TaxID=482957 RepID=UPI0014537B88|nr:VOC family protein [Burkholderia lata]VWB08137.1 glyoxalase [Burkholderia lata]